MVKLTPDLLLRAYGAGMFPMAERAQDPSLYWVDPDRRGVIPLDGLHIARRLKKTIRQGRFEVTADHDFAAVIDACAESTPERRTTWINETLVKVVGELHGLGYAHSIECWREGRLAGGLYGIALKGAFFGESMFSRARDASKVALAHLVARLRRGGFTLLDSQFLTAHLAQFGAHEIPKEAYRNRLAAALEVAARWIPTIEPAVLSAEIRAMRGSGADAAA